MKRANNGISPVEVDEVGLFVDEAERERKTRHKQYSGRRVFPLQLLNE
jgi:hypothetical protein